MFKRCKVVMLPTNEKSKIWMNDDKSLSCYSHEQRLGSSGIPQHLYILSNDEIKDGDWIFVDYSHRTEGYKDKGIWQYMKAPCPIPYWGNTQFAKKIIATTKSSLDSFIHFIYPSFSQSFIDKYVKEYNKNNKIENVMVEYDIISTGIFSGISKLKVNPKDNTISIRKSKESWNREEIITLLWNAFKQGATETRHKEFEDWINNNL